MLRTADGFIAPVAYSVATSYKGLYFNQNYDN